VRDDDAQAFGHGGWTHNGEGNRFVLVHEKIFSPVFALGSLFKPGFFGGSGDFLNRFALGLGAVEESFVPFGKAEGFFFLPFFQAVPG